MTRFSVFLLLLFASVGCTSRPTPAQLSGKVTFKGKPVPAGWISFTPDMGGATEEQVRLLIIQDGNYDSSSAGASGIVPGRYAIRIAGFDGKTIPHFGQGKQIFNPVEEACEVPAGTSTKDFVIPDSAGQNVRIEPTADT